LYIICCRYRCNINESRIVLLMMLLGVAVSTSVAHIPQSAEIDSCRA